MTHDPGGQIRRPLPGEKITMLTYYDAHDCQNCGSDCVAQVRTIRMGEGEIGEKVSCFSCGSTGPLGKNMEEAVRAWNRDGPVEKLVEIHD